MEQHWMNLLLFLGILLATYLVFRYYKFGPLKEGLDNNSSTTTNGMASNAQTFDTTLQQKNNTLKDALNISTYRQNYEDIILHLDEGIQYNALNQILTMDPNNTNYIPMVQNALFAANQARAGLNTLLKFVDKQ
jgi:uncharacterized protein YigE (DUF2233 family)